MDETGGKAPPTVQLRALESWRGRALDGVLTVAAIVAPVVVAVTLSVRSSPYSWDRIVGLLVAAVAFPILRFARGLPVATRAIATVVVLYGVSVLALTTVAFSSGPAVVFLAATVFAAMFVGRTLAIVMILLSTLAFLVIGVLSARGVVEVSRLDVDPGRMRNWVRTGVNFAFLSGLLTSAIDYVIRHVERASGAATEALSDLRRAYERLAVLHDRLDAAKEEERRFVATELHDELGQILTVVKLRLRMPPGPSGPGTDETVALVDQAIERVRKISRDLRPPLLDEVGLEPALRAYVEAQAALSGVPIAIETSAPAAERLPPGLEIACFRIVQESVTNALRHGGATRIDVRVNCGPSVIRLEIADDGKGFETGKLGEIAAGHLGVIGMQERVRARGGTFSITSAPGAGTRVEVEVPIGS
jgi:signal transduction histidine kinase